MLKIVMSKYKMKVGLNALHHLGMNLYSNVPAVISEVVANSWDADADLVEISIDDKKGEISIVDNGYGMDLDDCNEKYLLVGYKKRDTMKETPKHRHVMGRKGIGKLALFSIANVVEVQSIKLKDGIKQKNGFIMDAKKMESQIIAGKSQCEFEELPEKDITVHSGTKITLRDLKKETKTTEVFLRQRLARRFSVICKADNFQVKINGKEISLSDRNYFKKIEYLWYFGDKSKKYSKYCSKAKEKEKLSDVVENSKGYKVTGWIGTFDEQKSIDEGNNTIIIQAWGKLVNEDLLKDLKEGGLFSKYIIGEINADFLDADDEEDIITSDRQRFKEVDPRYVLLKKFVEDVMSKIQSKWTIWRNEHSAKKALENKAVRDWYLSLESKTQQNYAKKLFTKIEAIPAPSPEIKKELYKNSIIAFQTLALKDNLAALEKIDSEKDFEAFIEIMGALDELEATHYYQVVKDRLAVIKKFIDIVPKEKEKVIQREIFDHLWLLHPSWERASTNERMEQAFTKEFKKVRLTKEEKRGRVDIRYRTAAGKHIIIELKKYNVKVQASNLIKQVEKYGRTLENCHRQIYGNDPLNYDIICILGSPPEPVASLAKHEDALKSYHARYITYDNLIDQTQKEYKEFLTREKQIGATLKLISKI